MKCAEYIALWLKTKVDYVFGVQGGAVVHLFDACERFGPKPIYCHHEQAAGFAAVAYARVKGYGVCITTTGPGSTNAITPLLGAWQDSIPCMFISGQVRSNQTSYGKPVRQVGTQEAPILDIVRRMTKLDDDVYGGYVAEIFKAAYDESVGGRPGPVWLDIPQDVLWTELQS